MDGRKKFCFLRRLVMATVFVPLSLSLAADFNGIKVGQDAAQLPPTLRERGHPALRDGYHQGSWVRVVLLNEKVLLVDVVYSGEIRPNESINRRITLAQAIRLHTLREQSTDPQFGYAVNPVVKIIGLVDLRSAIIYRTLAAAGEDAAAASGLVRTVGYLDASAPVLKAAADHLLEDDKAKWLLSAARAAQVPPGSRR